VPLGKTGVKGHIQEVVKRQDTEDDQGYGGRNVGTGDGGLGEGRSGRRRTGRGGVRRRPTG